MARYIAVIHNWFVSSKGFDVKELTATDEDQANMEACFMAKQRSGDFNSTAYVVLPIRDTETVNPRKLTLRERIIGRTYK